MEHFVGAPDAVVLHFIDCINRGDVDGLAARISDDYVLRVFDEPPQHGKLEGVAGWQGYARAFPRYLIHPHRFTVRGNQVAVLGHTTGSHLGLPDEEERQLTLIWVADVAGNCVRAWTLIADTPEHRAAWGLAD